MNSKSLRTQAIVLRRTNYGEADRILQIITPEGRKGVIAKGVRREKSRLAGGIELFAVSDIVIRSGKGDLGLLTSARLIRFYRHILEDYDRLEFGYEAIKQVGRGSETVDSSDWYNLLDGTLAGLDAKSVSRELVETWFYVRYAELVGYELSLYVDTDGQKIDPEGRYLYDDNEKGFKTHSRGEITADHIKLLRLIAAKPLKVLAVIGGIEPVIIDCLMVARRHAALRS